jgi:hypothetical protein
MILRCFAPICQAGLVYYRQLSGSIGVLEAPDHGMPIGMANCAGWNPDGLAVWRLTIHGADVPGRWVIIDRRFVSVENASAGNRSGLRQDGPAASGDVRDHLGPAASATGLKTHSLGHPRGSDLRSHFSLPPAEVLDPLDVEHNPSFPRTRPPHLRQDALPASAGLTG